MRLIELEFLEWKDILWTRFIMRPTWVIGYETLYDRLLRKLEVEKNNTEILETCYHRIARRLKYLEKEYENCMEDDASSCNLYMQLIEEVFRGKSFPNVQAYLEIEILAVYSDHSIASIEIGLSTPPESESIPSLPEKIFKIVRLPLTRLDMLRSDEKKQKYIIYQVLRKAGLDPYDWRIYMHSELKNIVSRIHRDLKSFLEKWEDKWLDRVDTG